MDLPPDVTLDSCYSDKCVLVTEVLELKLGEWMDAAENYVCPNERVYTTKDGRKAVVCMHIKPKSEVTDGR